jgi:single-strand DNA-binding protein
MNTTTITGHVVQDPELRYAATGTPVTSFSVADNRRWQDRTTAEWQESTSYFDVVAWAELAENVATSLKRGSRVTVTGRLEQRNWETSEGDKRSKVEIHALDVSASLRYATVEITKANRASSDNRDDIE